METNRQLNQICSSFRFRLKQMLLQAGLARVVLVGLVLLGVLLTLDWWAHLAWPFRIISLLVYLSAVGGTIWWTLVKPARRKWSNREVLSYADSVLPPQEAMMLDLYELTQHRQEIQEASTPVGQQLSDTAVSMLGGLVERVRMAGTLRTGRLRRWLAGAAVMVLALGVVSATSNGRAYLWAGVVRLFNPFSTVHWPHRTFIALKDTPEGVPELESLTVEGGLTGVIPEKAMLWVRDEGRRRFEGIPLELVTRTQEDGSTTVTFKHTFEKIKGALEFYVTAADDETDVRHVSMTDNPYIKDTVVSYEYPDYLNMGNPPPKHTNQVDALEGTAVRVRFVSSMDLDEAFLVPVTEEGGAVGPSATSQPSSLRESLKRISSKEFEKRFERLEMSARSGEEGREREIRHYAIELNAKGGYKQAQKERLEVTIRRDNPPVVTMVKPIPLPSMKLVQTNRASVAVEFETTDDHGLTKAEIAYQTDDGKEFVLSDLVTGPIPLRDRDGKPVLKTGARFTWSMNKSGAPDSGTLTLIARAKDSYPGRAWQNSEKAYVDLVKPSEFHRQLLDQAKDLLNEATLGWRNQLEAYNGGAFDKKDGKPVGGALRLLGTSGNESIVLWDTLYSQQSTAFGAAENMQRQMRELTDQANRNEMAGELMTARLAPVAALVGQIIEANHKNIRKSLEAVSVGSDSPRLRDQRQAALKEVTDGPDGKLTTTQNQQMAVLRFERVLAKLYDWRDLQSALVSTSLMIEQQEEVAAKTMPLASDSNYIGKDPEDLLPEQFDKIDTLGKQQESVFERESQLEKQFDYMIFMALQQKRMKVHAPLWAAWIVLRKNRVNDTLKEMGRQIKTNQADQVLVNQKKVAELLRLVESGLKTAGNKLDDDPPITLAMKAKTREEMKIENVDQTDTADHRERSTTGPDVLVDVDPNILRPPEAPDTTLAGAIRTAANLQDDVLTRIRYLSGNCSAAEMPRFINLKQLMIIERQATATKYGLEVAIEACKAATQPAVQDILERQREEFAQFDKLVRAKDVSDCHQQAQADTIMNLKDALDVLGWEKAIGDSAAEKRTGVDSFGRQYVLRDKNLDAVVSIVSRLNHAWALHRDVIRKLQRFASTQPGSSLMADLEKTNRDRAAKLQGRGAEIIAGVVSQAAGLSGEVSGPVAQTGVGGLGALKLADFADPIAKARITADQIAQLQSDERFIQATVHALRDLMEEFVRPPEVPQTQPEKLTEDEIARLKSPEYIASMIKKSSLPEPIRERMLRALSKQFPPDYADLLSAYYYSFIEEAKKQD